MAPLYLSHSRMEAWQQCPRKFDLINLRKVKQAPSESLIIGDAVHQAIERDGRFYMAHGEHLSTDEIRTVAADAVTERTFRDDPGGALDRDAERRMMATVYSAISSYALYVRGDFRPYAVELPFKFDVPGAEDLWFTGRIDAMQRDRRGAPVVLDIKTGKRKPQRWEHTAPQAAAYLWAAGMGEQAPSRLSFVLIPTGYPAEVRYTSRTPAQLARYADSVRETAARISLARASGNFPAKTSPLCAWCPVLGHCRTGREYLLANGRQPQVPVLMAAEEGATA